MSRREKAVKLFNEGMNCTQAILLAYLDSEQIDPVVASGIAAPFGYGYSRHENGPCGAISGAMMVLGLKMKDKAGEQKAIIAKTKVFHKLFHEEYDTITCRELLKGRWLKKKACVDLVRDCCKVLDGLLADLE